MTEDVRPVIRVSLVIRPVTDVTLVTVLVTVVAILLKVVVLIVRVVVLPVTLA